MAVREGFAVRRRERRAWPWNALFVVTAWIVLAPRAGIAAEETFTDPHRDWDALLRRHVHGDRVDYDGFRREHATLRRYLGSLRERAPVRAADEIAFWINAYNAATVDLIVRERTAREGRLRSIKDIPAPWSRPRWRIAGADRTLDEIEHEILRKRFREPRIHFALVCASLSCPGLRPEAYRGGFLDAQLDSAARAFVRDPSRNRFEPSDGRVRISKIFDWYAKDFVGYATRDEALERRYGPERGAMITYVAHYLDPPVAARLRSSNARLEFLPYDWTLNSTGNAR